MADYNYLSDGRPAGTMLGNDATVDKVGFYGSTPVVKTAVAATAVTAIATTTISQVATSGKWAFATSTAATALVTRVRQLQVDVEGLITQLNTLGIV
jgi:hypothetical protein